MLQCLHEELQLCDICNELCEFDQIALTLDSCLDIELMANLVCYAGKADGEAPARLNPNVHHDLHIHFAISPIN